MSRDVVPSPVAEPLGRADELARIVELLETDTPVALLGEAGVGKTTIARAAIAAAGRRRHEGGGFRSLAWAPFLAFERVLGRSLAGGDGAFAARAVLEAVGDGVLFVDDFQWVDPSTREALLELGGRLGLVIGVRTGDAGTADALDALPAGTQHVELGPLALGDATDLARRIRPELDLASAAHIARRCGGNPLLVTELTSAGDDAPTLASVVRLRLAALDASASEAIAMLALAGHPVRARTLGPGAGLLVTSGLAVVDADTRLRVRHELIGAAALERLDPDRRRRLHARLARRLSDPGEAARQHAAAGERALAHARALEAVSAATSAGGRAAHLALAADTADGDAAQTLRLQAAALLVDNADGARSLAVLGDLIGREDPAVALAEARAYGDEYRLDDAAAALDRGMAFALRLGASEEVVAGLHVEAALHALRAAEPPNRQLELAEAAVAHATRHETLLVHARALLGEIRYDRGDPDGLDDMRAAMSIALATGRTGEALRIGNNLVFALLRGGHALEGRALAGDLEATAQEHRLESWARQMAGWQVGFAWHGGQFGDAVATADRLDLDGLSSYLADWYRAQALVDLGRHDEVRLRADRILASAVAGEFSLGEALWLQADAAFASGRYGEAIRWSSRHEQEIPTATAQRIFVELPLAWSTLELGRPPTWPVRSTTSPIAAGGAIELEAIRDLAEGRHAGAVERFDEAADRWAGRHSRGALRSRYGAAEALRRGGDRDAARARLLALEEELLNVGHEPLLGRVRRSLRQVGVRRAAARTTSAGSPLTGRETEILRLSARGLADREIAARLGISRWAVVRAAESGAAKLGSGSRTEAILAAVP